MYTQYTIINIKRKPPEIIPNTIMSTAVGFVCQGLKNEFELAVVKEPSVFEPLKFHCISDRYEELERRQEEKIILLCLVCFCLLFFVIA